MIAVIASDLNRVWNFVFGAVSATDTRHDRDRPADMRHVAVDVCSCTASEREISRHGNVSPPSRGLRILPAPTRRAFAIRPCTVGQRHLLGLSVCTQRCPALVARYRRRRCIALVATAGRAPRRSRSTPITATMRHGLARSPVLTGAVLHRRQIGLPAGRDAPYPAPGFAAQSS